LLRNLRCPLHGPTARLATSRRSPDATRGLPDAARGSPNAIRVGNHPPRLLARPPPTAARTARPAERHRHHPATKNQLAGQPISTTARQTQAKKRGPKAREIGRLRGRPPQPTQPLGQVTRETPRQRAKPAHANAPGSSRVTTHLARRNQATSRTARPFVRRKRFRQDCAHTIRKSLGHNRSPQHANQHRDRSPRFLNLPKDKIKRPNR
jgi:hypothetical protein